MDKQQITEIQTYIDITKLGVDRVIDCVFKIDDYELKKLASALRKAQKAVHDRIEELNKKL